MKQRVIHIILSVLLTAAISIGSVAQNHHHDADGSVCFSHCDSNSHADHDGHRHCKCPHHGNCCGHDEQHDCSCAMHLSDSYIDGHRVNTPTPHSILTFQAILPSEEEEMDNVPVVPLFHTGALPLSRGVRKLTPHRGPPSAAFYTTSANV